MEFEKQLVLNKYFLNLFGYNDFYNLREDVKDIREGFGGTGGRSYLVNILIGKKPKYGKEPEWETKLLRYDEAIEEYVERLRENGRQPKFNLKYFQYLAVLFTEIFFDNYYNNKANFISDLNIFLENFNKKNETNIPPFIDKDFKKLAFWMATGSGKTLIMHINYWQILKYSKNNWDNILLITPNEGLSKQHYKELRLSGIPCKLYDGNIDNLKTKDKEVLIIDIHKLTKEKKGKGVTVDISYFDGKNLVFIDEGHEGQKSEEQKWKKLREEIGKNGFLFEYSATFGQIIGKNEDLLEEYAKAIIFDYSYKYFYTDGYGKDFYVFNIKTENNTYTEAQKRLLFIADLLSFYEQLIIFEKRREELRKYNIEKPLWVFVGSKVTGKGVDSEVVEIVRFLNKVMKDESYLKDSIEKILDGKSELRDNEGEDIFKNRFEFVRKIPIDEIIEGIYQKVFGGKGRLELYEIKNAEGEIGLKSATGEKYFGVINVGNVRSLKKLIKGLEIEVKEDHFSESLFFKTNESGSPVNILIGSKKFIKGWNSWRVSNMGLMNVGKGEGPQIIQLFGRGVRLKGKDCSLQREENPDYWIKTLQTLFIFGLDANYIDAFLSALGNEGVDYKEVTIPIRFNSFKKWEKKIYTIKTKEGFDFLEYPVKLEFDEDILSKIKIDLRPKITLAHGLEVGDVKTLVDKAVIIPDDYFKLLYWDSIYSEIMNYKISKGMFNLLIDKGVLKRIVLSKEKYKIFTPESPGLKIVNNKDNKPVLEITSFEGIKKLHNLVLLLLKDYIQKFYRREEKKKIMDNLEAEPLTVKKHSNMFPEENKIIVKIPRSSTNSIKELIKQLEQYDPNDKKLPQEWVQWSSFAVHFDNHLYTPLIVWREGNREKEIKSVPVKLNKGEKQFVMDLKNFLNKNKNLFENSNVFLLRNLSRKGIGFFTNVGFYPDFIMWIRNENKQNIIFIDPKGLRNVENFHNDKVQLCVSGIKEVEKVVNKTLKETVILKLDAFITSVSSYNDIKSGFGEGECSKEDFEKHNIVFQEDSNYIEKILKKVKVV